jgi:hypothetical protein
MNPRKKVVNRANQNPINQRKHTDQNPKKIKPTENKYV